jgi:hypothetical protein
LYRIELHVQGEDPRLALRMRTNFSEHERHQLVAKLARVRGGAWPLQALRLISSHPATRAAKLASMLGMETQRFKTRVRQLKDLGLTESLEVGYRLSPRGVAVLGMLDDDAPLDQRSVNAHADAGANPRRTS